jgi:ligand-binding sensor domain-containing protein
LPTGVDPSFELRGPDGSLVAASELGALPAGPYTLTVNRVYDTDPIVRSAFDPEAASVTICQPADNQQYSAKYQKVASSNQLWTLNGPGAAAGLLGFGSDTLAATGAPPASSAVDAPVGNSLAFDFDGNLWAGGASVGDPDVQRFPAAALGGATAVPDLAFSVPAIGCVPAIKGLAVDATGDLWLSTCKNVLRIPRSAFTVQADLTTRDVDASVTLSGLASNEDVAFDKAGNLWVAGDGKVSRFDKARLAHDDADAPDLTLSATTDDVTPKDLAANFLAFDKTGNLWALNFAGNAVFEITKADLAGTGTKVAVSPKHVVVDVEGVLARPAFDDGGALWLPLAKGKFGKLTPAWLAVNSDAGSPTAPAITITSADVAYASGLAFFPAASGLPLASAQP